MLEHGNVGFRLRSTQPTITLEILRRENPVASALMAKMNIAPKDRPQVKYVSTIL